MAITAQHSTINKRMASRIELPASFCYFDLPWNWRKSKLHSDGLNLKRFRWHRHSVVGQRKLAGRALHQVRILCGLRTRRKLDFDVCVLSRPLIKPEHEAVVVLRFLHGGEHDVVGLNLQKTVLRSQRSLMFFG